MRDFQTPAPNVQVKTAQESWHMNAQDVPTQLRFDELTELAAITSENDDHEQQQTSPHNWHHWPGWKLPGGAASGEGL